MLLNCNRSQMDRYTQVVDNSTRYYINMIYGFIPRPISKPNVNIDGSGQIK